MKLDGWQIPLLAIGTVFIAGALTMFPANSQGAATVAAWVQAFGSIGAILIAIWVLHAQQKQARADDHGETRAFVQSVRQEIDALWTGYDSSIRPLLLGVPENGIFGSLVPVTTEAFTVYNNSSARVGKIDDDELRRLIVITYARAKGYINSLQTNNALLGDLTNFEIVYRAPDRDERLRQKVTILAHYAVQLKEKDAELAQHVHQLIEHADRWLL
ncbi:hypothetical protein [Paraburkholderia mimosarum]|uniref:hypothetical protein n=1 Tax=Paraburkholderia mimosarum TaxID=312026 RepID=UPI000480DE52|nr:hypothetical protein [Paraburkholderia mimosarum]